MTFYALRYRYRMHCQANGDDAMAYDEWCKHIIECGYTLWLALTDYTPWKPWRWAVFKWDNVAQFLRFVWETEVRPYIPF